MHSPHSHCRQTTLNCDTQNLKISSQWLGYALTHHYALVLVYPPSSQSKNFSATVSLITRFGAFAYVARIHSHCGQPEYLPMVGSQSITLVLYDNWRCLEMVALCASFVTILRPRWVVSGACLSVHKKADGRKRSKWCTCVHQNMNGIVESVTQL